MKVVKGYPPNYDQIAKRFDLSGKSVVFTYDGILYDPLIWSSVIAYLFYLVK